MIALSAAGFSAAQGDVTFELIPDGRAANDLSPDGRYVVGSTGGAAVVLYRWDTLTNTFTTLPDPGTSATAVSDDGSVVIGNMNDPANGGIQTAGRWTEATGWVPMGGIGSSCGSVSSAYELSADGTVAVGLGWNGCSGRGFRWTEGSGMVELEGLANGNNRASACSAAVSSPASRRVRSRARRPAGTQQTAAFCSIPPTVTPAARCAACATTAA